MGTGAKKNRLVWVPWLMVTVVLLLIVFVGVTFALTPVDTRSAHVDHAKVQLRALARATRRYWRSTGHWPQSVDALEKARLLSTELFMPPDALDDPWGHPYVVRPHGAGVEIRSCGENGGDPSDDFTVVVTPPPGK